MLLIKPMKLISYLVIEMARKTKNLETYVVIRQDWEESERDWGTRPDGTSLHKNPEDLQEYIKEYWASMPKEAPDEYSRPDSKHYKFFVTKDIYKEIAKSKNGIRLFRSYKKGDLYDKLIQCEKKYGSEKTTGWMTVR